MKFPDTLRDDLYRDPAKIYEDAEEKTCVGCVWISRSESSLVEHCAKGEKYGKRCESYVEKRILAEQSMEK